MSRKDLFERFLNDHPELSREEAKFYFENDWAPLYDEECQREEIKSGNGWHLVTL